MYKLILDTSAVAVWSMSAINTVTDLDLVSASGLAQFAMSVLGVVYLGVRIVNDSLNGRVNREKTRLENKKIELENQEMEEDFDAFSRHERDN